MGILKYLILVWLTMTLESYTFESTIQAVFPYKDEHGCCEEYCDSDSDGDTSNTTSEEDTDNFIEQNNVESNGIVIYSGQEIANSTLP